MFRTRRAPRMTIVNDRHDGSVRCPGTITEAMVRDDRCRDALELDLILPSQVPARTSVIPEQRLLLAVLEEAVRTYKRYTAASGPRGRRLFTEVDDWFASDAAGSLCDFVALCDVLGLDPSYVRSGLRHWSDTRHGLPAEAPASYGDGYDAVPPEAGYARGESA